MVKNGKLFCFIGAGLFLINAVIFFAFHTSVPVILGVASLIVAIAIAALALIPRLRIVFDIVSIVGSFLSAYLLTRAIRPMPTAIVVPSNLLVFLGFVLVLVGGALEIWYKIKHPSAKKHHKSKKYDSDDDHEDDVVDDVEDNVKQEKKKVVKNKEPKEKAPKRRKKQKEYIPPPVYEYNLNSNFQYEPEVIKFIEYIKKEKPTLQNQIGQSNIAARYAYYKIPCNFDGLPDYKPDRETVTPMFFVHMMKWVINDYCDQHLDDKLLPYRMNFALEFDSIMEKGHLKRVLKLSVDNFALSAVANSMINDDLLKARRRFNKTWNTERELKFEDFSSNLAWLSYKRDKEDYDKYCRNLETKAHTRVYNHVMEIITPIAKRLYESLNLYLSDISTHSYIVNDLVVDVGSMNGAGKIGECFLF